MNRRTPAIAVTARMAITGRFSRCSTVDTASGYRRRHRSEGTARWIRNGSIEEGYDRLGSRYLEWTTSHGPGVREWFLDEVLQRLPADADVLELGCGPGTVSPALADGRTLHGGRPVGRAARARSRAAPGCRRSSRRTSRRSSSRLESFDAVVAFFVFNHLPRAEHAPMFARVYSWLRPGGRFMLSLGASDTDDEVAGGLARRPDVLRGLRAGRERARAARRGVRAGALGDAGARSKPAGRRSRSTG